MLCLKKFLIGVGNKMSQKALFVKSRAVTSVILILTDPISSLICIFVKTTSMKIRLSYRHWTRKRNTCFQTVKFIQQYTMDAGRWSERHHRGSKWHVNETMLVVALISLVYMLPRLQKHMEFLECYKGIAWHLPRPNCSQLLDLVWTLIQSALCPYIHLQLK